MTERISQVLSVLTADGVQCEAECTFRVLDTYGPLLESAVAVKPYDAQADGDAGVSWDEGDELTLDFREATRLEQLALDYVGRTK